LHLVVGPTSPIKQSSYRSGIVSNVAPAVVPLVMAGDQSPGKAAPSASSSPAAAAIRDTKVVKKKKAELPQHNLPHPVPKFGDWLNSRTMINNYIILETLGTGGYAEVKLCKEKLSGKLFAMKFISRDVMKKDKLGKQSKLDDIKREIAIMKKLNHPNVLRLYEVMDDPKMNKLFLVLEYMKHGDMLSFQKKKHPQGMLENLRDRDLHSVFLQVILGLAYLHEQKIVHGDIKPQNLLVGEKDVVKIADFGISQSLYGSKQKIADVAGTPAFMSPEMCSGEEYSGQLADVWALGATIFMLKFGSPPFVAKSAMQMFDKIQSDPLVFPSAIDPLLAHLLTGMLTKVPQKRLTLLDVMVHPWVTKNEKHSVALDALHRPCPPITVSTDEIEHAVGANHIAIVVNIRKQMLKRLTRARESLAAKEPSGAASQGKADSDWDSSNLVFAQSPKAVSAKNAARTNRVFAVTSDAESDRKVLSNEEIDYRSQLFSRKKASNKNALEAAPVDHSSKEGAAVAHAHHTSIASDALDDDDALSDDDDELAVSQSPQLLDELLLTTLSMPPLTKASVEPPSLFVSRGEIASHSHSMKPASSSTASIGRGASSYPSLGRSTESNDDQRFYGESPALAARYGVSSLEGRRNTQEDRWVVFPSVAAVLDNSAGLAAPWATETAYVGIYDGHGGEECANILHDQLHTWIFRSQEAPSLLPKSLQDCFESLDSSACDYLLHKDDLSGSTATSLVLRPAANGNILLTIAHVGDCRLVLGKRDGRAVDLTRDHRLTLETERERVLQLGGRVVNNRVNGVMAITRAFGDLEFKGLLDPQHGATGSGSSGLGRAFRDNDKVPPLLTAKPDVSDVELKPSEDAFLLLACDGLWDVIESDEAADIFRERVELHGDLQRAAHELAQEGIRRYSNDNITVIAILLQPPVV
jgi:serine/threonine protein kinase/serine/threonine protein phosphatase PrpC